jgi:hypothetical protein
MSPLRTLKKLVLGETWVLPLGVAALVVLGGLVLRPVLGDAWDRAGGFVLLAGVLAVLVAGVALSGRPPRPPS